MRERGERRERGREGGERKVCVYQGQCVSQSSRAPERERES